MEQIYFGENRAAEIIKSLFRASRLIPFIGSGFTKGLPAKKGRVLDANGLTSLITTTAASREGLSPDEVKQLKAVNRLKSAFSLLRDEKRFTQPQAMTLLENIFSKVNLSDDQKVNFLRLDWPHIFTFNVDDAIETKVHGLKVLSPNRDVSREYIASNKCLFKIHGDIHEYLKYKEYNLVFTWKDYTHSIEKNRAMLSYLSEQAKDSTFLFIGCSLDAEIDLLNLTHEVSFSKSIFLKKGTAGIEECLTLEEYGIDRIIYFDTYEQISEWVSNTLNTIERQNPNRDIAFDDSLLTKNEAIRVIANGGPLDSLKNGERIAKVSRTFPQRTMLQSAATELRSAEFLLVTGRRFSGKTLFLFQLMESAAEYGTSYYSSLDSYTPAVLRELEQREQHLFVFDSNFLNAESLEKVARAKLKTNSKVVICASLGDAENFRYLLGVVAGTFKEIKLTANLHTEESKAFNSALSESGLPVYKAPETLLTFAYRYYGEFKSALGTSNLFSRNFDHGSIGVLMLIAGAEKAQISHINAFNSTFGVDAFLKQNDRIFERIEESAGDFAIVCNSSAWLLTELGKFIQKDPAAVAIMANIAISLNRKGFYQSAASLIRFDKLNELGNGSNVSNFVRGVYSAISNAYKDDLHYWLQRAKSELIAAASLANILDGMGYARKVRLDSKDRADSTYYSATLVLAQLYARAYKLDASVEHLIGFLENCLESIRNYANNRRHIDKLNTGKKGDFNFTLKALDQRADIALLPHRKEVRELLDFFGARRSK
ncbi:hypothetical protein BKP43_33620 [Variovorax boronicumulans]|uniref:AVAST type 5 anti-phage protein Avs5 n=1 Tax=Variovorax boronicumulans TaxID=436515 RepID=UPI000BB3A15E|nr:AVAST type 5 anti-phage protein Avs5 [Variovorax boronicumulans]PBI88581.1 hypothetical protein BKP43_33620 [Variovorax boronicumulans]